MARETYRNEADQAAEREVDRLVTTRSPLSCAPPLSLELPGQGQPVKVPVARCGFLSVVFLLFGIHHFASSPKGRLRSLGCLFARATLHDEYLQTTRAIGLNLRLSTGGQGGLETNPVEPSTEYGVPIVVQIEKPPTC